jgi:hypothetical protein
MVGGFGLSDAGLPRNAFRNFLFPHRTFNLSAASANKPFK